MRSPRLLALPALAALVLSLACGRTRQRTDASDGALRSASAVAGLPAAPSAPARGATMERRADAPGSLPVGSAATLPEAAPDEGAPMIVRNGSAAVDVDSLERGVARLRELVSSVPGAYVGNSTVLAGQAQERTATLEVRVPSRDFDRLLLGLSPLGRVVRVNATAEDVGEEYVDVAARTANAQRLEARLVDLLAHRTGKLADVLEVEQQLARVREEIERSQGRLRYLRTRAAMSTLSVTLREIAPLGRPSSPAVRRIAEACSAAWDNFLALLAGAIALAGWLVPLGALGFAVRALWRRAGRRAVLRPPA